MKQANIQKIKAMMQGKNLYRVTVQVEGNNDFTVEVNGDCEKHGRNSANTHAMAIYPYRLNGQLVTFETHLINQ